jgi:hypothetical protein
VLSVDSVVRDIHGIALTAQVVPETGGKSDIVFHQQNSHRALRTLQSSAVETLYGAMQSGCHADRARAAQPTPPKECDETAHSRA